MGLAIKTHEMLGEMIRSLHAAKASSMLLLVASILLDSGMYAVKRAINKLKT